jgi:hypothetical protein
MTMNEREMIPVKVKYLEKYGISTEKAVHSGWIDHQNMIKKANDAGDVSQKAVKDLLKMRPLGYFDKWQYIFTSNNGSISLIRLFDYYRIGEHLYEIYCLDKMDSYKQADGTEKEIPETPAKEALPDIRRFYKHEEAMKCIIEILRTDK